MIVSRGSRENGMEYRKLKFISPGLIQLRKGF